MAAVDGVKDVATIARELGLTVFEASRAFYCLAAVGVVRTADLDKIRLRRVFREIAELMCSSTMAWRRSPEDRSCEKEVNQLTEHLPLCLNGAGSRTRLIPSSGQRTWWTCIVISCWPNWTSSAGVSGRKTFASRSNVHCGSSHPSCKRLPGATDSTNCYLPRTPTSHRPSRRSDSSPTNRAYLHQGLPRQLAGTKQGCVIMGVELPYKRGEERP